MLDPIENIDWRALAAPLAKAERELGRLAHALDTTPLHATWLWREVTRAAPLRLSKPVAILPKPISCAWH